MSMQAVLDLAWCLLIFTGLPTAHTWTLLAETANAGSSTLVLQQAVDWNVDDEIVLATTGLRHSQRENEKAVIAAVSGDGFTLTLKVEQFNNHSNRM